MRNQLKTLYSALVVVAALGLTNTVHGVPAFARQTGLDCTSCHSSSGFPTLNSFGMAFKAAGYTQGNDEEMVGDGETLSIPKSMNVSVVTKLRLPYDAAAGTFGLDTPDEIGILAGGRVGKNIGWMTEIAGPDPLHNASFKLVFAPELGPVRLGIVPWFSDLTPAYMFEVMSTGAVPNIRSWEEHYVSAMMTVNEASGIDNGEQKSGLGLYVWHSLGYLVFTPFMNGNNNDWITAPVGYYTRLAVTPSFGSVNMAVGVQYYAGNTILDPLTGVVSAISTLGVDAQAHIAMGNNPLAVYVSFADNMSTGGSMALAIAADIAIVQDVLNAGLAFNTGLNTGANILGVNVKYHIVKNIEAEVDFTYNLTASGFAIMPRLFAAF